ncbi:hypothetical protein [Rhodovulum bhavnagarense]|uniref:hypothetical protein n=1 Tax=Rhodovulum bhavnagarense TaxID=992286 RepID=UPI001044377C|nr:hypothetical protein [Rhodovulum bhavnagarense]
MALITTSTGGHSAAQAVLEEAEEHYRRTIRALHDLMAEIQAGQSGRARELRGALGDLGKAAQTAFDERVRVEKRLRSESGIVNDYAIDLDGARAEIGRRLDRLRTARGSGEVPGRAE